MMLALILNSRRHDDDTVSRAIPFSPNDPWRNAPTIAKLPPKSTTVLVDEKMSRFKKNLTIDSNFKLTFKAAKVVTVSC